MNKSSRRRSSSEDRPLLGGEIGYAQLYDFIDELQRKSSLEISQFLLQKGMTGISIRAKARFLPVGLLDPPSRSERGMQQYSDVVTAWVTTKNDKDAEHVFALLSERYDKRDSFVQTKRAQGNTSYRQYIVLCGAREFQRGLKNTEQLGVEIRIASKNAERALSAEKADFVLREEDGIKALARSIEAAGVNAPQFVAIQERFRYRQRPPGKSISERKKVASNRCVELQKLCASRSNEQPLLARLAHRYSLALTALRKDRGAYSLLIAGLELESLVKIQSQMPHDPERNPQLDGDLLHAVEALIVAHAGLMAMFPDTGETTRELDQYRQNSEAVDALSKRILDPVMTRLCESSNILDAQALLLSRELKKLSDAESVRGAPPSRGASSVQHGWLRGALSAMGNFVLKRIYHLVSDVTKKITNDVLSKLTQNPDALVAAVLTFFQAARSSLLALAGLLSNSFGWIRSFFSLLGLG
jgi:hypothetical protein